MALKTYGSSQRKPGNVVKKLRPKSDACDTCYTSRVRVKAKPPLVQSRLAVGSKLQVNCSECGMSYVSASQSDVHAHRKFHSIAVEGPHWSSSLGKRVCGVDDSYIVRIDHSSKSPERKAAEELLNVVNIALAAPTDYLPWKEARGAVYVYVANKRAVGIVAVQRETCGRWMQPSLGQLLPGRTVSLLMGVARIFVYRKYRRRHIATKLLDASASDFIYGTGVKKHQVGWIHPSASGSLLAANWAGEDDKILCVAYDDVTNPNCV
jgi:N-acetyltransferase